ncbi:MerR family transcriptional regulator [Limosilactobacillus sp.]|uniref:MerR family transcriptional regulator n=1 Tax=Limosilactobacillus sp. TaxID=2773925 RepID=UPI00345ECE5F
MQESLFRMIFSKRINLGMTEMSKLTHVSPSQLRYWERKGFIKSKQDENNKNHYFNFYTMLQVATIKYYLDQGFTLKTAVAKEKEHKQIRYLFHTFLMKGIKDIDQPNADKIIVDLGALDDDPTQKVCATVTSDGEVKLHLRPTEEK